MTKRDDSHDVTITWRPEDLQTINPKMSLREAKEFFKENFKIIRDRSIEEGWTVLEILMQDWASEKNK